MTKIAVLCPTLGRPELLGKMLDSIELTADDTSNIRIVLGTAHFDSCLPQYEELLRQRRETGLDVSMIVFPDWTMTMCMNAMSYENEADIYFGCADDLIFVSQGWDKALRDSYASLTNKIHVWSMRDGLDEKSNAILAMSKEYNKTMGYFLPPFFMHWYCDTWTAAMAKYAKCFTHLECIVTHHKKTDDDTYQRVRDNGGQERDNYLNASCQHFLQLEGYRLGQAMK